MKALTADLGDLIFETLTFCYEPSHKQSLVEAAKTMGATFEQMIAAALAERISENFEVRCKTNPGATPEGRSFAE